MLQIQTFLNTVELERLHREDELPKGDIVATARRFMAIEGSLLLLLRDAGSWDVEAVFVDVPEEGDRLSRKIYSIYSGLDSIEAELFREHLRTHHARIAEVHTPSNTRLNGEYSTWRIMRHKRQAVGVLTPFKFIEADKIEKDIQVITEHGETARLEIHLSKPVRTAEEDICKRLAKLGFATRKYVYHIVP